MLAITEAVSQFDCSLMKKYSSNVIGQLTGNTVFLGFFDSKENAIEHATEMCGANSDVYANPFAAGPFLVTE